MAYPWPGQRVMSGSHLHQMPQDGRWQPGPTSGTPPLSDGAMPCRMPVIRGLSVEFLAHAWPMQALSVDGNRLSVKGHIRQTAQGHSTLNPFREL